MKALVKERAEPGLSLLDIPAPKIVHPDEVLFEVGACAICTGELKVYDWGSWAASDTTIQLPTVLGHEAAGVVVDVGNAVIGLKPGDRVVVDPILGCGRCVQCRSGHHNMCPDREIYGKRRGAFAQYAVLPERALCPMPDGLTMAEGAMLENLGIAVHAIEDEAHDPGNVAVVIGAGPIGILAAQTLSAWGVRVVVTDRVPFRLAKAKDLVDGVVVDVSKEDVKAVIAEMTAGKGADFVLEAAATQSALDQAFDLVRFRGTVVTIGTFDKDVSFNPFFKMTRKEIRLVSRMGRTWETWRRMMQVLDRVDLAPLVSDVLSFDDFEHAFARAKTPDVMKVVLTPSGKM